MREFMQSMLADHVGGKLLRRLHEQSATTSVIWADLARSEQSRNSIVESLTDKFHSSKWRDELLVACVCLLDRVLAARGAKLWSNSEAQPCHRANHAQVLACVLITLKMLSVEAETKTSIKDTLAWFHSGVNSE